jgi:predicted AlkP superfamily phosphohydrolase/phosphomutase
VRGEYGLRTADSRDVRVKRLWDYLGDAGHRVAPLFVPLTYPPTPVRGVMASCFLTPEGAPFTFPPGLGAQLEERHGAYHADVRDFRTDDLDRIWGELHAMAEQHVAMARDVLARQSPEFMMMVEMGPDRFHHAFFSHFDARHPLHQPGSAYADAPERYYAFLDAQLGKLLADVPPDCTVMIVSDHGAKSMLGGFCINDWLSSTGFLQHAAVSAPHAAARSRRGVVRHARLGRGRLLCAGVPERGRPRARGGRSARRLRAHARRDHRGARAREAPQWKRLSGARREAQRVVPGHAW